MPDPQSAKVLTVYRCEEHRQTSIVNNWCPVCGGPTMGKGAPYLPTSETVPRAVAEELHEELGQLHAEAFVAMQDLMAIAADAVPEPRQAAAERYESLLEYLDRTDAALKSYREAVPDPGEGEHGG